MDFLEQPEGPKSIVRWVGQVALVDRRRRRGERNIVEGWWGLGLDACRVGIGRKTGVDKESAGAACKHLGRWGDSPPGAGDLQHRHHRLLRHG